ncbi:MAG: HEAT repeat domain-containing protein [Clostridia bacterium]|nr:HEAT repeat domain-containing protein [Clostridia bacterium]
MKLSCIFGHKWNGCRCARCGEIRDTGHDFEYKFKAKNCLGTCRICQKTVELPHDFKPVPGKCYMECARCHGQTQPNHQYQSEPGSCKRLCSVCGKVVYRHSFVPVPGTDRTVCSVCGREGVAPLTPDEQSAIGLLKGKAAGGSEAEKRCLNAVDVLAGSRKAEAVAALAQAVRDSRFEDVKEKAMDALEKMAGDPDGPTVDLAVFDDVLRGGSKHPTIHAIRILGRLKDEAAIPMLIGVVSRYREGQDFSCAHEAISALGQIGERAVPAVLERAEKGSPIRPYMLRALALIGSPATLDVLKEGLTDDSLSDYDQKLIAQGLGNMDPPEAAEALIAALDAAQSDTVVDAISQSLEKLSASVDPALIVSKRQAAEIRAARKLLKGFRSLRKGMREEDADDLVGPGSFQMGNNVVHKCKFGEFQLLVSNGIVYDTLRTEGVIENIKAWLKENDPDHRE